MTSSLIGAFEELVLLALVHLGGEGYGMQVRREIERRSGRKVAIGAVYATLERMQEKRFLATRVGGDDEVSKGRRRKYFAIQPTGAQALRQTQRLHQVMWQGVDAEELARKGVE